MNPTAQPPVTDSAPPTICLPTLSDDAVIQIHDLIHRVLDLFEARYGEQIRRFYEDLGGDNGIEPDDPPF